MRGGTSWRRRLVLLRHGRTADNASGRIQGQLDTPLDDVGRAQAVAVAPFLAALGPALLLSSDLSRARNTAEPLAAATGLGLRLDARLRELDLGGWQGLTGEQARERFPQEHADWVAGRDVPRGGGESYAQAGARAVACLLEALDDVPASGSLVAVTHGGTAKGALCLLLDVDPAHWWRYQALDNTCSSVLVEHRNGWRLEAHGVGPAAVGAAAPTVGNAPDVEPVRY